MYTDEFALLDETDEHGMSSASEIRVTYFEPTALLLLLACSSHLLLPSDMAVPSASTLSAAHSNQVDHSWQKDRTRHAYELITHFSFHVLHSLRTRRSYIVVVVATLLFSTPLV